MTIGPQIEVPAALPQVAADGVFISYKRKDCAALAGWLYEHLDAWFPGRIFMDVRDITPGDNFRDRLKADMSRCCVVVVLVGPAWEAQIRESLAAGGKADYVVAELQQALASNLIVVPLLIDGTPMPSLDGLPGLLEQFQFRHALEVRTSSFVRDIQPLRTAICRISGIRPPALWEQLVCKILRIKTVDEPTRAAMAHISFVFAAIGIIGLTLRQACSPQSVIMLLVAGALGLAGVNSRRWKWIAYLSLMAVAAGLALSIWLLVRNHVVA